jgi:antitoxin (DNA-binding transcriptional repressor) of toxin-antitoxin stability system
MRSSLPVLGLAQLLQGQLGSVATRLALGLSGRVIVARHGKPACALVPLEDLERLETLDANKMGARGAGGARAGRRASPPRASLSPNREAPSIAPPTKEHDE